MFFLYVEYFEVDEIPPIFLHDETRLYLLGFIFLLLLFNSQVRNNPVTPTSNLLTYTDFVQHDSTVFQSNQTCTAVVRYPADIETCLLFPQLDLNPAWLARREYWGYGYEDRYKRRRQMWAKLPLK